MSKGQKPARLPPGKLPTFTSQGERFVLAFGERGGTRRPVAEKYVRRMLASFESK